MAGQTMKHEYWKKQTFRENKSLNCGPWIKLNGDIQNIRHIHTKAHTETIKEGLPASRIDSPPYKKKPPHEVQDMSRALLTIDHQQVALAGGCVIRKTALSSRTFPAAPILSGGLSRRRPR
ncbi:hypothetical protein ACPA9J_00900 [Pseudomonas aeruginosa]